jgi:glycosyltransferase involved in cell wall biosynthesis
MYSLRFTILPLLAFRMKNTGARIILAPRGMLQEGAMHFKTQKKKFFIGLLKFMGIASKIHFHATDDQERMDVLHYFPANAGISVVPNFPKSSSGPFKTTLKEQGTVLCIFISRIAPKKNLLYLLELLDALPERINLRLDIYGESEDEAYFEKCRQVISKFPQHISVNFKGSVPNEEAHAVLEANHLFVLPTKGENFGHAIYESLLAGRPVLISDRTPWKGMQAKKAGWDIPLEKPVEFLKAIQEMAEFDQQEFDDWCLHAWEYARQYRDSLTNLKEDYLKLFS